MSLPSPHFWLSDREQIRRAEEACISQCRPQPQFWDTKRQLGGFTRLHLFKYIKIHDLYKVGYI